MNVRSQLSQRAVVTKEQPQWPAWIIIRGIDQREPVRRRYNAQVHHHGGSLRRASSTDQAGGPMSIFDCHAMYHGAFEGHHHVFGWYDSSLAQHGGWEGQWTSTKRTCTAYRSEERRVEKECRSR